jgi:cytochrome c oxidase subunit IV
MGSNHTNSNSHGHSHHHSQSAANNGVDSFFDGQAEHHIMPLQTYYKVGGALFILTFLTIGFHMLRQYMGPFSPFIAFTIAAVKAYLVLAWFMHLKFDVLINRVVFGLGFVFLMLLFAITALDIYSRANIVSPL